MKPPRRGSADRLSGIAGGRRVPGSRDALPGQCLRRILRTLSRLSGIAGRVADPFAGIIRFTTGLGRLDCGIIRRTCGNIRNFSLFIGLGSCHGRHFRRRNPLRNLRRRILGRVETHPRPEIEVDAEGLLDIEGAAHRHHPDVAELSPHHAAAGFAQHEDVFVVHVNGVGALHQRERARIEQKGQRPVDADQHQVVFQRPCPERIRHFPEPASAEQRLPDGIAADVREGKLDAGDAVLEHMDPGREAARDQTGPGHALQLFHAHGQERTAGLLGRPGGQIAGVHLAGGGADAARHGGDRDRRPGHHPDVAFGAERFVDRLAAELGLVAGRAQKIAPRAHVGLAVVRNPDSGQRPVAVHAHQHFDGSVVAELLGRHVGGEEDVADHGILVPRAGCVADDHARIPLPDLEGGGVGEHIFQEGARKRQIVHALLAAQGAGRASQQQRRDREAPCGRSPRPGVRHSRGRGGARCRSPAARRPGRPPGRPR